MAPGMTKKFSNACRSHLSDALRAIRSDVSSARFSVQYLRPKVRAVLLKISAGERVHPEIIRINLSGCVKSACLKAVVFTIPSKVKGLRVQSSDVFLGDPGLGKGLGAEWCEDLLTSTKTMLMDYAKAQYHDMQFPVQGPLNEGVENKVVKPRVFKHFDGVELIANMNLPFLVDLPNGSCEAVFLTASRNCASGVIQIHEYLKDKQTIVDKLGTNGVFLGSHDTTMKPMVYKTTESVPEMKNNSVFWQIYINLEDSLD